MRSMHSSLCALLLCLGLAADAEESAVTTRILRTDTALTTTRGNAFVVPGGWSLRESAGLSVLTAPASDSHIAIVDVEATDADSAAVAGWSSYLPGEKAPTVGVDRSARNGWALIRQFKDPLAPSGRTRFAQVFQHEGRWTVAIYDMDDAVAEMRDSQLMLIFSRLTAKGFERETFAGRRAHSLDAKRLASLTQFIEHARRAFDVPGVAIGIVQNGKLVLAEGFGVREVGKSAKVDANTLFLIASNTKPLTTLMLAKLVDAGRFEWETKVNTVMPRFALADAISTKHMQMKHLVCACTGLPRQDFEWIFESERLTPEGVLATVATMQPTSEFGALYQYSNLLAGTAGYTGGHVLHPDMELGAAYDAAMQALVFDPLGMQSTTFDFARAQRGNHAAAHSQALDGSTQVVDTRLNLTSIPSRPDGGAWSNVHDLLSYVRMELANGVLPDGSRYIAPAPLLARRVAQVSRGDALSYGMGLKRDETLGVLMIHHGGSAFGAVSDVLWLPEYDVGAVILTNADNGTSLRNVFRRRLLELLFDGKPEAQTHVDVFAKRTREDLAEERANLTVPADSKASNRLARRYHHAALGDIIVSRKDGRLWFDFGGWRSEVGSVRQDDATTHFVTLAPGARGFEFEVADTDGERRLMLRDAQQAYAFVASKSKRRRPRHSNSNSIWTSPNPVRP